MNTQDKLREEYRAIPFSNYSGLKLFSTCPRLFYETYEAKTYKEPDHDYFVYGSLVDCILTTPDELEKMFVRVDRKVDVKDTLKHEMRMKELKEEMRELEEKVKNGNKTAIKGHASRDNEWQELAGKMENIGKLATLKQVTGALWDNAIETAEAIKRNPTFLQLTKHEICFQQTFVNETKERKGILDYVCLSGPAENLYLMFKGGLLDYQEFRSKIAELSEADRVGWIWDIKTTALISTFDPRVYGPQLAWYRELVYDFCGIRCRCGIIAGDKDPTVKRSQDYVFDDEYLDRELVRIEQVEKMLHKARRDNFWPGAKEFRGIKQNCFKCSICSDRPFSVTSPLIVSESLQIKHR